MEEEEKNVKKCLEGGDGVDLNLSGKLKARSVCESLQHF
jgi:hypothetical protein